MGIGRPSSKFIALDMFFRSVRCFTGEIHQLLCFAPRPRAKKNFTQGGSNKDLELGVGFLVAKEVPRGGDWKKPRTN